MLKNIRDPNFLQFSNFLYLKLSRFKDGGKMYLINEKQI